MALSNSFAVFPYWSVFPSVVHQPIFRVIGPAVVTVAEKKIAVKISAAINVFWKIRVNIAITSLRAL